MSTPFKEFYAYTLAAYTADTGSTGLNNSASPAYVREWFRAGDTDNRGRNWPQVIVSLVGQSRIDKIVANGGGENTKQEALVVQFDVLTKADQQFDEQDAVVSRLLAVFDKITFTPIPDGDQWQMNELVFVQSSQVPMREEESVRRWIIRARVDARKVA